MLYFYVCKMQIRERNIIKCLKGYFMCTALSLKTNDCYFGRTLDIDRSYGEEVCVLPRKFRLNFSRTEELNEHYAMMGMATVFSGTPLFYDATNEHGLAMAGLNFPENAYYRPDAEEGDNVASFELIPWVLCNCKSVAEAEKMLASVNITQLAFSKDMPPTPLHWMISDKSKSIVVEQTRNGLHIYENTVGVLTNNPPFPYQLENLKRFSHLRIDNSEAERRNALPYSDYSQGLGAFGLPGDVSSISRFIRAAFGRKHSVCDDDESSSVGQFFHILSSVKMVNGLCRTDAGTYDKTLYTSCINTTRGLYYYTTYENRRICCIDMHKTDLNAEVLTRFRLLTKQSIEYQN